jgi:hypothetical protein
MTGYQHIDLGQNHHFTSKSLFLAKNDPFDFEIHEKRRKNSQNPSKTWYFRSISRDLGHLEYDYVPVGLWISNSGLILAQSTSQTPKRDLPDLKKTLKNDCPRKGQLKKPCFWRKCEKSRVYLHKKTCFFMFFHVFFTFFTIYVFFHVFWCFLVFFWHRVLTSFLGQIWPKIWGQIWVWARYLEDLGLF